MGTAYGKSKLADNSDATGVLAVWDSDRGAGRDGAALGRRAACSTRRFARGCALLALVFLALLAQAVSAAATDVPPAILTTSLPGGTVGEPYSAPLSADGTSPMAWSVSSGSLPPGLGLNSDGLISGTPTEAGTFSFTVTAMNDAGSDEGWLSVTISPAVPDPTVPAGVTATLSAWQQVTLSFTTPADKGSPVVRYDVEESFDVGGTPSIVAIPSDSVTFQALASTITVKATDLGLADGVYQFRVSSVYENGGKSIPSAWSNSVIKIGGEPAKPTNVTATFSTEPILAQYDPVTGLITQWATDGRVELSFPAPANNGSPITSYVVEVMSLSGGFWRFSCSLRQDNDNNVILTVGYNPQTGMVVVPAQYDPVTGRITQEAYEIPGPFKFRVVAVNARGYGEPSDWLSGVTDGQNGTEGNNSPDDGSNILGCDVGGMGILWAFGLAAAALARRR
ncbi:MAG: putative Ig domain-containing protein [Synergistaceae bacterium]|jgi:hypothetical protein|nr:putative Ig domain-containing protein [Synergistaceae bacterium]